MHGAGHFHYHASRLSKTGVLLWAHTLKILASGLVGVFIPLYLYNLKYSFQSILVLFFLVGLFWVLLLYPTMKFMNRYGATRGLALGNFAHVIIIGLLITLPDFHWPLWLIGLASGVQISFYWPSFRILFTRSLAHKKTGRNVGMMSAVTSIGSGLAPAVGGVVATVFGITYIYYIAIALFIVSAVVVLAGEETVRAESFSFNFKQLRRYWHDLTSGFSNQFEGAVGEVVWPFFIFFLVPSYAGVGLLSSVTVVASILIALYVGRREEARGERHYLKEGIAINTFSNSLRILTQNAVHVTGVNLITGLASPLYLTAFNTRYYKKTEEYGLVYLFPMQFAAAVSWMALFAVLYGVSFLLPDKETLLVGILLAIPASLGIMRIR